MARINVLGIDELMDDLYMETKDMPEVAEKMVEAAGDVMVEELRNQIKKFKIFDLGATWWGIKRDKVRNSRDGTMVEVWPAGRRVDDHHPSGERIETVAFVAEYGTEKVEARPFMSTAVKEGADRVADAMMEVWEKSRT